MKLASHVAFVSIAIFCTLSSCQKLKNQLRDAPVNQGIINSARNIFNFPGTAACRVTRFSDDNQEQLYSYDNQKRLTGFTWADNELVEIEYNATGLPATIYNFNRQKTVCKYDADKRLSMLYFYDPELTDSVRISYPGDLSVKAEFYEETPIVQYYRQTEFNDQYDVISQHDFRLKDGSFIERITTTFSYQTNVYNFMAGAQPLSFLMIVLPELGVGNSMYASRHCATNITAVFHENDPPVPQTITQTIVTSNSNQYPTKMMLHQDADPATINFTFEYACD